MQKSEIFELPFEKIESKYFNDSIPLNEKLNHFERLIKEIQLLIYSIEGFRMLFEHSYSKDLSKFFYPKHGLELIILHGENTSKDLLRCIPHGEDIHKKYESLNAAYNRLKVIEKKLEYEKTFSPPGKVIHGEERRPKLKKRALKNEYESEKSIEVKKSIDKILKNDNNNFNNLLTEYLKIPDKEKAYPLINSKFLDQFKNKEKYLFSYLSEVLKTKSNITLKNDAIRKHFK